MSLAHAILGVLNYKPMTGYELKTVYFDDSIAHFWSADQAQIYRTLDKLAEQSFVNSQIEIQEDRPNRKIYSITEAGRAEFHRWLLTEQALPAYREPFLVQLFFANELDKTQIITAMEQQLAAHEERFARYEAIPLPILDDPQITRDLIFPRMTLEVGLRLEQAYIDWLKECLERVKKMS